MTPPLYTLENDFLRLQVAAQAARILHLSLPGGPNWFASPDLPPVSSPYGEFHFWGGHRLWHAPEALPRTYLPDQPAERSLLADGLLLQAAAEPWTGFAKSLEIHLHPSRPRLRLVHRLRNEGPWTVQTAAWALTMFRLGGLALFPQRQTPVDAAALLPNRQLTLWPYTRINDPRLSLADDFLTLKADPQAQTPFKLGFFNPQGWQAYWLENALFVKRVQVTPGVSYPDGGCNTEAYCNHQFLELESLSPLVSLAPGESLEHVETWEIFPNLSADTPLQRLAQLAEGQP